MANRVGRGKHPATVRGVGSVGRDTLQAEEPIALARRKLQSLVDEFAGQSGHLRVLDAGCGSRGYVEFSDAHIVGMDISPEQLARNTSVDEKILGDVQTHALPESDFDIVVCWNVLEHLPHPDRALRNLARSLKPDGLLILRLPNVLSLKGLLTKFTPHVFHVWVYRSLLDEPDAGRPGHAPFPTFLRYSISPNSIKRGGRRNGLSIVHASMFEGPQQQDIRARLGIRGRRWDVVKSIVRIATLNKVTPDLTDCIVVLKRRP
jgi:SAM-dependent methyltransferase